MHSGCGRNFICGDGGASEYLAILNKTKQYQSMENKYRFHQNNKIPSELVGTLKGA